MNIIDRDSKLPLHKQAELYLRELITSDKYKNGKLIPKRVELSEQMKISGTR